MKFIEKILFLFFNSLFILFKLFNFSCFIHSILFHSLKHIASLSAPVPIHLIGIYNNSSTFITKFLAYSGN